MGTPCPDSLELAVHQILNLLAPQVLYLSIRKNVTLFLVTQKTNICWYLPLDLCTRNRYTIIRLEATGGRNLFQLSGLSKPFQDSDETIHLPPLYGSSVPLRALVSV